VSLSFKTPTEIFAYPPALVPGQVRYQNYIHVLANTRISTYILNSVVITIAATLGNLLVTVPAAFAFSRFKFRLKEQLLFFILMFQMISQLIVAIPLYRYFVQFGMLNNHATLVMIYITVQIPFTVWLLKGYFDSIPIQIDEAALIDGCGERQALFSILLPLSVPGIATALVFNTINAWGQFIIPYIFLRDSNMFPISVGILFFLDSQTEGEVTIQFMAAAAVIGLLPAITVILGLQKFIVRILTAGAVKG
jgi:multiple sugar transport system permease protein